MRTSELADAKVLQFFATAAKGTEGALRDELNEARFRKVKADRGGVHFEGPIGEGMRACLESRIAARVLCAVSEFDAPDGQTLYDGVRNVDWNDYIEPRHTLAVRASCKDSALTHTQFIAQRTKDAIVDQQRARYGVRPNVNVEDADLGVFVHLVRDHVTLYVDLAGEALHRRGYRTRIEEAPLKENLAAAILRLSGWNRDVPLVDPMCGSGTFPIEAALWSRNVAPGIFRSKFSFERWVCHDAVRKRLWSDLRDKAIAKQRSEGPFIAGSDISPLDAAKTNAKATGMPVRFSKEDVKDLEPTDPPGFIVTNPPYGERLAIGPGLYRDMGRAFARLSGHTIVVLAGTPDIPRAIPLQPAKEHTVFNGPIECRLFTYQVE
ncbi:MAG TPA: THUMP domain-containing protein [Polyangium sp.]|nr:THUMP domain-containing protein [Polyangium sp.]